MSKSRELTGTRTRTPLKTRRVPLGREVQQASLVAAVRESHSWLWIHMRSSSALLDWGSMKKLPLPELRLLRGTLRARGRKEKGHFRGSGMLCRKTERRPHLWTLATGAGAVPGPAASRLRLRDRERFRVAGKGKKPHGRYSARAASRCSVPAPGESAGAPPGSLTSGFTTAGATGGATGLLGFSFGTDLCHVLRQSYVARPPFS